MPRKTAGRKRRAMPPPALSPCDELDTYMAEWLRLTPKERLARSWALRKRIPDLGAVHDAKLFPQP